MGFTKTFTTTLRAPESNDKYRNILQFAKLSVCGDTLRSAMKSVARVPHGSKLPHTFINSLVLLLQILSCACQLGPPAGTLVR